jgi:hypothetical protein
MAVIARNLADAVGRAGSLRSWRLIRHQLLEHWSPNVKLQDRAADCNPAGVVALCLALGGCTTSATTEASAPSPPAASSAPASSPSSCCSVREQIDAAVGQRVILNVKSDIDEELHAHMGLDGYALTVWAANRRQQARLRAPGSFVLESHHLGKTIVILNVR